MARKVLEVSRSGVPKEEVKARLADSYVKPSVQGPGALEQLASELVNINPNIQKYLQKKQEEKRDFEYAEGEQIYRHFIAEGRDLSVNEIQKYVANGDIEGFKHLTSNMKQGVVRARYEHLGNTLETRMLQWYGTATVKDENGNDVPITQLKDENRAMTAFAQEAERLTLELTGGSYDPVFYKEFVEKSLANAQNQFIQNYGSTKRKIDVNERIKAASNLMDDTFRPLMSSGALVTNATNSATAIAQSITTQINSMMADGLTKLEAAETVAQWLQAKMVDKNTTKDGVDVLLEAAQQVPGLMSDPEVSRVLSEKADNAKGDKQRARFYAEQEEQAETENAISEDIYDLYSNGYSQEKADAIIRKYGPKYAHIAVSYANAVSKLKDSTFRMTQAMEPEQYNALRIAALSGNMSNQTVLAALPLLDEDQQTDLINVQRATARAARAEANAAGTGASSATKYAQKEWKEMEKEFKEFWPENNKIDAATGRKLNYNKLKSKMMEYGLIQYRKWKQQNPNADYGDTLLARSEIMQGLYNKYGKDTEAYMSDASLLEKTPEEVHVINLLTRCKQSLAQFTPEGASLIRRASELKSSGGNYSNLFKKIRKTAKDKNTMLSDATIEAYISVFNEYDALVQKGGKQ